MARPNKEGLDYFSYDTDLSQDPKVEYIEARFGLLGYAVFLKLLEKVFGDKGYYLQWDERYALVFSKKLGIDVTDVQNMVSDYLNEGLFHLKTFEEFGILTSESIQVRYIKACAKRNSLCFRSGYLLVDPNEYKKSTQEVVMIPLKEPLNRVLGAENLDSEIVKGDFNSQSKGKQSKEEESKHSHVEPPNGDSGEIPDSILNIQTVWNEFAESVGIPRVLQLSDKRISAIKSRAKEPEFELDSILKKIRGSPFLLGKKTDFRVSFDFVFCSKNNYLKILEGQYDKKGPPKKMADEWADFLDDHEEDV